MLASNFNVKIDNPVKNVTLMNNLKQEFNTVDSRAKNNMIGDREKEKEKS